MSYACWDGQWPAPMGSWRVVYMPYPTPPRDISNNSPLCQESSSSYQYNNFNFDSKKLSVITMKDHLKNIIFLLMCDFYAKIWKIWVKIQWNIKDIWVKRNGFALVNTDWNVGTEISIGLIQWNQSKWPKMRKVMSQGVITPYMVKNNKNWYWMAPKSIRFTHIHFPSLNYL